MAPDVVASKYAPYVPRTLLGYGDAIGGDQAPKSGSISLAGLPMTIAGWMTWRRLRQGLLSVFLTLLLLVVGFGEFHPKTIDLIVAPYQYSFLNWELSHLPDKWFDRLKGIFPGEPELNRAEKISQAQKFFDLGVELDRLQKQLSFPRRDGQIVSLTPAYRRSLEAEIEGILERRRIIRALVEETIEGEVGHILSMQGIDSPIGVFPPVDAVFSSSPHVLVLSPRDHIYRQQAVLLEPGLTDEDKEGIERRILVTENLAALVEDTGGVAVYPSVVSDTVGMHHAVVTTAHEWLHHWFFFRPLGRNFWSNQEMTTLNETAATVAGEELGDLAFTAMTGKPVNRGTSLATATDPNGFDFNTEMRETRRRTDELLAQGKVDEAEAYMEERRQILVSNGFQIRKINQAYFAFHGSYATSPASTSPIGGQMQELRSRSDSLEDFLQTVSRFSTYQEFLDHLSGLRGE